MNSVTQQLLENDVRYAAAAQPQRKFRAIPSKEHAQFMTAAGSLMNDRRHNAALGICAGKLAVVLTEVLEKLEEHGLRTHHNSAAAVLDEYRSLMKEAR